MKNIIVLILSIMLVSCTKEPKHDGYIVSGSVKGIQDGTITMVIQDVINRKQIVIDSTTVSNGKFEFKGKIEHPDLVNIMLADNTGVAFFLENSTFHIEADMTKERLPYEPLNAVITGGILQSKYDEFSAYLEAIRNEEKYTELNRVSKEYSKAGQERNGKLQEKLYVELGKLSHLTEERGNRIMDKQVEFVKANPSLAISPSIIGYSFGERSMSFDEMTDMINVFQGDAKETKMYKYFVDEYESIKSTRPGGKAPEFALKDTEGKEVSLSSTKGKYVLLDFWASWCKPCRASYPHLKEVYKKYKAKGFEVFAISTDTDHDKWKKAIKEDGTEWIQVVDTFKRPNFPSDIGTLYAIPYLPTTFLLDKDGVILAKNLHADELDKKLEEIFGF